MTFHVFPTELKTVGIIRQYIATITGVSCYITVGSSLAWPSPTLIKMENGETPVVLDVTGISWMVSLMFLGHMLSPVPTGYLMDMFGRKRTLLILSISPVCSWLLILFASTEHHLYIGRFLAGIWAGVTATILPLYVGEIAEPNIRPSLASFNNLLINFGVLFTYILGPYVSYNTLAIVCTIVSVLYTLIFVWMPESPYYLMQQKKRNQAFKALSWLRGGKLKQHIETELNSIEEAIELQTKTKGSLMEIFTVKAMRKGFIISEVYAIVRRLAGSGVLQAYASVTLPKTTFGILDQNQCVIILGLVNLVLCIVTVYLTAHFTRQNLLTISSVGCGISMTVIMVWFYLDSNTNMNVTDFSYIVFVSFIVYNLSFPIGLGPVGTSIKGEMFPANIKALCSSITTVLVAITSFILNKFYLIVAYSFGMYVNYIIFAFSCYFAIIFTCTYVPETSGKTLQEIQEVLGERNHKKKSTHCNDDTSSNSC